MAREKSAIFHLIVGHTKSFRHIIGDVVSHDHDLLFLRLKLKASTFWKFICDYIAKQRQIWHIFTFDLGLFKSLRSRSYTFGMQKSRKRLTNMANIYANQKVI